MTQICTLKAWATVMEARLHGHSFKMGRQLHWTQCKHDAAWAMLMTNVAQPQTFLESISEFLSQFSPPRRFRDPKAKTRLGFGCHLSNALWCRFSEEQLAQSKMAK